MQDQFPQRKYVFIGGHHRSGTSVLAFNIGRMENCTAFENTGVGMDEGQYLQTVYATDVEYGGVGLFAFDARAHLTETSSLLTPENVTKLKASWDEWWDQSKSICVEKTPGNMIMGRFLQAAFENSCFIVIKRHPVAACLATQKWSRTSLHSLFKHWLRCHEIFAEDKPHLRQIYELTYEDYIENQNRHHQRMAEFIGARPPVDAEPTTDSYNKKYLDRWHRMLTSGLGKKYHQFVAAQYEARFARHNYSLFAELEDGEQLRREAAAVPRAVGAFCCVCADAAAFVWRWASAGKRFIKTRFGWVDEVNRIHRQGGASQSNRQTANLVEQPTLPLDDPKT
jgi:hypothetical protein